MHVRRAARHMAAVHGARHAGQALYREADKAWPPWAAAPPASQLPCDSGYGAPTMQDFNNAHGTLIAKADLGTLGIDISNVTHGSGWQVFDPQCQLHNYLHDYLMFKEPVVPEARNKTIRILYIGDSVDRHPIAWYAALLVSTGFMF